MEGSFVLSFSPPALPPADEGNKSAGDTGASSTREDLGVSLTLGVPRFALKNTFGSATGMSFLSTLFSQDGGFPWEDQGSPGRGLP